jgi:hypothetical protein
MSLEQSGSKENPEPKDVRLPVIFESMTLVDYAGRRSEIITISP